MGILDGDTELTLRRRLVQLARRSLNVAYVLTMEGGGGIKSLDHMRMQLGALAAERSDASDTPVARIVLKCLLSVVSIGGRELAIVASDGFEVTITCKAHTTVRQALEDVASVTH